MSRHRRINAPRSIAAKPGISNGRPSRDECRHRHGKRLVDATSGHFARYATRTVSFDSHDDRLGAQFVPRRFYFLAITGCARTSEMPPMASVARGSFARLSQAILQNERGKLVASGFSEMRLNAAFSARLARHTSLDGAVDCARPPFYCTLKVAAAELQAVEKHYTSPPQLSRPRVSFAKVQRGSPHA